MKFVLMLLAAAAFLVASPALAQDPAGHYDAGLRTDPDTHALAFIRIPLGENKAEADTTPVIGFGLFRDCTRMAANLSPVHRSACESQPIRSFEMTRDLYDRNWLISFSGTNRWVGIARWFPERGFGRVSENGPVLSGPAMQRSPDN